MPITQLRMFALLSAATDFECALRKAESTIAREIAAMRAGTQSAESALSHIEIFTSNLLATPGDSVATLAIERKHMKTNFMSNARAAQRQRNRRATPPERQRQSDPGMEDLKKVVAQARQVVGGAITTATTAPQDTSAAFPSARRPLDDDIASAEDALRTGEADRRYEEYKAEQRAKQEAAERAKREREEYAERLQRELITADDDHHDSPDALDDGGHEFVD